MSHSSAKPKPKSSSETELKTEPANNMFQDFLARLYDTDAIEKDLFTTFYEGIRYNGFNREENLINMMKDIGDIKIIHEIILAGALRGPIKGSQIVLSNGKTAEKMGIPASRMKGKKGLSMNKVIASTADLAAYILKTCNAPKRINSDLPAWLQFPSAGSIKMPDNLRSKHREFSMMFSDQIGGVFNEQIYAQMEVNSYVDPKLRLF
jgi:hypothetical protein